LTLATPNVRNQAIDGSQSQNKGALGKSIAISLKIRVLRRRMVSEVATLKVSQEFGLHTHDSDISVQPMRKDVDCVWDVLSPQLVSPPRGLNLEL
jgi:hypothetical protein